MNGDIQNIIYYLPLEWTRADVEDAFSKFVDDVIYCVDSGMTREEIIEELKLAKEL